ncbi:MAG: aminoglycoside phosphotransferase family protein [Oscillospiraceae bacterium]|jgi:Ser/Thr protein kinase RdoA (MazF antagonist)|nr:aminoglycoside phosphotransferase family protein [Oscillospiraceae bacterium]
MDIDIIKKTFEAKTHKYVQAIHELENVPNNRVYRIETESCPYIFKIYSSLDWPENGKLAFVAAKLREFDIPVARILVFCRDNDNFPNGYLIEECLPGITADRLTLSAPETLSLFGQLGELMSRVHTIKLTNFGYFGGSGIADWSVFSEFIYNTLSDCTERLIGGGILNPENLEIIRNAVREKLRICDKFPSALCHGDLSTKNALVDSRNITLIDWDDALALCWTADIARMTLWLKLNYDVGTSAAYRKAFLDHYETDCDKNIFDVVEDALHVFYGLDLLNYYAGTPMAEKVRPLVQNALRKCEIAIELM